MNTNQALIAKAREVEPFVRKTLDTTVADLVRDLADALEAAAGVTLQEPGEGSSDREKLIDSCDHPENCNHRYRVWNLLVDHANDSRRRGKGSPNEESRVGIVFDWMVREGFNLASPVQVDEVKLVEVAARVYDEAAMDSPADYPLQYTEAMQYGRETAKAVAEWLRGGGR